MRFSDVLAASLVAPLVAAHGGGPQIVGMGRDASAKLRVRGNGHAQRIPQSAHHLDARQGGLGGQCGPVAGGASCDAGYCCSPSGWCGKGPEYCMAPDCLIDFGPGCDANQLPSGGSTKEIARPQLNPDIEYGGVGIYACREPGTVAITYDDGPYIYTNDVLDQFAAYGFKATFFITGININKGSIDDESLPWPAMMRRMIAEGHQVASHTWSHQNLDAITSAQRYDQMVRNEMAFANVLGKFPTYMRPPYSACITPECEKDMADLGYVVTYFDLDTDDYNNESPDLIQNAKDRFANAINPSNPAEDDFLAIGHDIHQQTAQNLTGFMLDMLVAKGYRGVTTGECLGDPEANWYRAANGRVPTSAPSVPTPSATSSSVAFPTPTGKSNDGTCGNANGLTCIGAGFGDCCSPAGWCGSSVDHCGTGCQSGFGTCPGDASSSITSSVAASTTSSAASSSVAASSTVASSSSVASSTSAAPSTAPTAPVSTDGMCAGAAGQTCAGSEFGDCCSAYGWCGASEGHCGEGCNPLFGNCPGSAPAPSSSVAASSTVVPTPASSTVASSPVASTSAAPSTAPAAPVSTDGMCAGAAGQICVGSEFGDCCSAYGWCGSSEGHCGAGCNTLFGKCPGAAASSSSSTTSAIAQAPTSSAALPSSTKTSTTSTTVNVPTSTKTSTTSSAAAPSKTPVTSRDGTCGGANGYTCKGFAEGQCCSQYGYCGNTQNHCMTKCNTLFGFCGRNYMN